MSRPTDPPVIDAPLLGRLLAAAGPQTIESLAVEQQTTRESVARELQRLRAAGCRFDEHPQHGVTLVAAGLGAWVDYLQHHLGRERVIEVYQKTSSTQDIARRMTHAPDGSFAVTDEQTAGRGRLGRSWVAPAGTCLMFSRRCTGMDLGSERLTLATSVAIAQTLDAYLAAAGKTVAIKWPNDLYVDGRKLAGILVERTPDAAIVGVGINVNLLETDLPPELNGVATSLAMQGVRVDRLRVLADVMAALDAAFATPDLEALLGEWRGRCIQLHERIRVQHSGNIYEGEVLDLSPTQGLVLRSSAGAIVHLPSATTTTAV